LQSHFKGLGLTKDTKMDFQSKAFLESTPAHRKAPSFFHANPKVLVNITNSPDKTERDILNKSGKTTNVRRKRKQVTEELVSLEFQDEQIPSIPKATQAFWSCGTFLDFEREEEMQEKLNGVQENFIHRRCY
jgi:hypothetical protein